MNSPLPRSLRGLALLLIVYLAAPLIATLPALGQADWQALQQPTLWQAVWVSCASATLATLLIALCGIPLAYQLAHRRGWAWRVFGVLVQAPLALPPLASGVLLLFLLGPYAPLGAWSAAHGLPLTDSFAGVVLAEAFVSAPFLVIAARSAFAALDPSLEEVAATLGLTPQQRLRRVVLPLVRPALSAGLLLSWLRALGEFGATVMVAYHPYSLPVFTFVSFGSQGLPAMLPILAPTLGAVVLVAGLAALAQGAPQGGSRRARQALVRLHAARGCMRLDDERTVDDAPTLSLRLRHRYGDFSLDVPLTLRGRRVAILGPSGSGKSLSLRLLAGLQASENCTIRHGGVDLARTSPQHRGVAYVPQRYALFAHLSVAQQVLLAPGADAARAAFWCERLGLWSLLSRLPHELSLGQQQRVALVRALAQLSRLLLLDEPFSALDTPLREHLRRALRALQQDIEATTILVTHDPEDAARLADEIVVLDGGRVLQHGTAADVLRRPASTLAARLLGVDNVFLAHVLCDGRLGLEDSDGQRAELPSAPVALAAGRAWLLRLPPTALRWASTAGDSDHVAARCLDLRPGADGSRHWLALGALTVVADLPCSTAPLVPGSEGWLHIDVEAIQYWPAQTAATARHARPDIAGAAM